ncbi:flagellar protein FliL, putative [Marinomonas sp. MED121]|jgi:flagellar FliL protein|uniref:flagellar basal body-associated FliL family protein n=1 Tax=Marinomonas sp. MED121 TaxID=314277 RepID=UPI00006900AB|nr:flagellar basal body-associated FliL family protein [Marinomonas sp. MED121]EAQ65710.1 flagellar protein FliL, putative [Marinomonas sp. MED121]
MLFRLVLSLLFSGFILASSAFAENDSSELPVYIELRPDFIVNYTTDNNRLKYIKASITIRATGAQNAGIIESNMPIVRDGLVIYLSELRAEQVTGAIAREESRKGAAIFLNEKLKEETGIEPVKDVLFSSFVTQ